MKFNEAAKIIKDMEKSAKAISEMVDVMGVMAINHYKKSFTDGGFTDETLQLWKHRKREDRGRYAKNAGSRAVLVKTGKLKRSLVAKKFGRYAVRITSNVNYANVHNEGLRAGRGKGFIMKKRQFVGYSGMLSAKIELRLRNKIQRIFK